MRVQFNFIIEIIIFHHMSPYFMVSPPNGGACKRGIFVGSIHARSFKKSWRHCAWGQWDTVVHRNMWKLIHPMSGWKGMIKDINLEIPLFWGWASLQITSNGGEAVKEWRWNSGWCWGKIETSVRKWLWSCKCSDLLKPTRDMIPKAWVDELWAIGTKRIIWESQGGYLESILNY